MPMSFFKEAREIIRSQPASPKITVLREQLDELQEAFDLFVVARTTESLKYLVGCWTRVSLAIAVITGTETPPPSAGKMREAKLAA